MLELNLLRTEKWPDHSFALPQYQSHRGFWINGIQENTLESLIEAKKMGFKMAEFDVQLSRDHVPVLFHDTNLLRLFKKNIEIKNLHASELNKMAHIPTLKEVLLRSDVPDYLNIEIKSAVLLKDYLVEPIARVIRETKSESRIIISSFNPWCLLKLKQIIPEVPLALLASPEKVKNNLMYLRRLWTAPLLRPNILNLDYQMLDENFLKLIKKNNLSVVAWTVNDKNTAKHLLNSGVRSIITDQRLF
ncbi:MAG: glycerophosphodiester phosphodiesterase [Bdellovibrionota bacterium]